MSSGLSRVYARVLCSKGKHNKTQRTRQTKRNGIGACGVCYHGNMQTHEEKLQALFAAQESPAGRRAFGRWLRQQRIAAGLTQAQVGVLVGGMAAQSLSRVESGAYRLGFDKLTRLLQPLAAGNWDWTLLSDGVGGEPELVIAGPLDQVFSRDRVAQYETLADDGKPSRSHAPVDPTTALLLTQWEKLDTQDRAMVLGLVLRLAESYREGKV